MRELHLRFICLAYSTLFVLFSLMGQVVTVFDANKAPLTGVEVFTENFSFTGTTDLNGQIRITDIPNNTLLSFKFLGFETIQTSIDALEKISFQLTMSDATQLLSELIIIGRNEVNQAEVPFQIETIDQKEIASTHAQTSADALSQHGGVFVQKSQMGGGSPVIRGFEANRVLMVVDGVRLNNAIYRSGHLQNAITIDPAVLQKMEVIFGPNSLMYGSDALGGVVHFETRKPKLSLDDKLVTQANVYVRHASANSEKSVHFDFGLGGKRFGSFLGITIADYGDLRQGGSRGSDFPDFGLRNVIQQLDSEGRDIEVQNENPLVQEGTGYKQYDFFQKLYWKHSDMSSVEVNLQYSASSNVPRYDNLTEKRNGRLRWAQWDYGPQKRLLSSISYRNFQSRKWADNLVVIGAYQKVDEDRISRRFGNDNREEQREDVNVYSLTLDLLKNLTSNNGHVLYYGADYQYNEIQSNATETNIRTGSVDPNILSRYASDGNQLQSVGAYLSYKGKTENEILNYSTGLRYSLTDYEIKYDLTDPVMWPAGFYEGIGGSNAAFTWSIGATVNTKEGWQLRSMISTAFRSPNIDDLSKIRVNNDEITFPNLELKPEKSFNAEITVGKQFTNQLSFGFTTFYTSLSDAIVRKDFVTPSGSSTYETNGEVLNVVGNQNVQDAFIYGISANIVWPVIDQLRIKSSLNYTQGRERIDGGDNLPFTHIPPLYGSTDVDFTQGDYEFKGSLRYNGNKPLSEFGGSADNADLASPFGAENWTTFNLYAKREISKALKISLGIENVFDQYYRPFSSGVSGAGRNFIVELRGSF